MIRKIVKMIGVGKIKDIKVGWSIKDVSLQ